MQRITELEDGGIAAQDRKATTYNKNSNNDNRKMHDNTTNNNDRNSMNTNVTQNDYIKNRINTSENSNCNC